MYTKVRKPIHTILAVAFAVVLSISALSVSASARGDYNIGTFYDGSFAKAWEKTYGWENDGFITYGFNTLFIDEDYCWAEHRVWVHWAELYNGNGWYYGPYRDSGKVSKIEVMHSGTRVVYECRWG